MSMSMSMSMAACASINNSPTNRGRSPGEVKSDSLVKFLETKMSKDENGYDTLMRALSCVSAPSEGLHEQGSLELPITSGLFLKNKCFANLHDEVEVNFSKSIVENCIVVEREKQKIRFTEVKNDKEEVTGYTVLNKDGNPAFTLSINDVNKVVVVHTNSEEIEMKEIVRPESTGDVVPSVPAKPDKPVLQRVFMKSDELAESLSGPTIGHGDGYVALVSAMHRVSDQASTQGNETFILKISHTTDMVDRFRNHKIVTFGDGVTFKFPKSIVENCLSDTVGQEQIKFKLVKNEVIGYQVLNKDGNPAFKLSISNNGKIDLVEHNQSLMAVKGAPAIVSYTGDVMYGKPHGMGVAIYVNGNKFNGIFKNGQPWTGDGFVMFNGNKYFGVLKEGKPDGAGILIQPDGKEGFRGTFHEGKPWTGDGVLRYSNGGVYDGNLIGGKPDGRGIFRNLAGDVYKGHFSEGWRDGEGEVTYASGKFLKYVGSYKKNEKCGVGILTYRDGSEYNGGFQKGVPHGKGKLIQPDGTVSEGQFINGNRHGEFSVSNPASSDESRKVFYDNGVEVTPVVPAGDTGDDELNGNPGMSLWTS